MVPVTVPDAAVEAAAAAVATVGAPAIITLCDPWTEPLAAVTVVAAPPLATAVSSPAEVIVPALASRSCWAASPGRCRTDRVPRR